jgi:hypothetical protein
MQLCFHLSRDSSASKITGVDRLFFLPTHPDQLLSPEASDPMGTADSFLRERGQSVETTTLLHSLSS